MITGRRVFIQSILALCITAAALVFVFPLRTMLRSPLETRISGIKAEFEETFSGYITYDSISPDMVNRIEIINPSLAMHPSGISAERVTVTYPFWIILSGSRDLPLVTIDIEGFTGYFDLDEDFPEIILPFMFFIDRIDVNFDSIDMAFDYGGSRMENSFEKTALSLYLQKHEFTGEFNSSYHTISGEYNGYARTSLHSGISYHEDRISLQLPSLSADVEGYGSFENFPLLMVLDEQMLFASLHSKNVAALLNYSLKDRELHLSASSEGFSLDETLSIYYESDVVDIIRDIHDLRFNVSVKGILGDGFTFSDISYEGDFRLPEFNYSDISLAYLQGSMSGSLEEMNIQNFQGRINDIPFRYRGTVDIARMTPDGRLDIRMPEHITSETFSVLLEGIGERRVSMDYIHDSFQLRSEIDYHDQANISFDTLVMISDRTYSIPFEYDTKNNFISSLPDADVSFTLDMHQGHAKIFLQWDRFLIPTENTFSSSIPTSGKVIGSIRSLEDFRFTVQSLVIHSIPLGEHRFDLSMKGHITPDFANISSITYQDAYDSINGAGSVVFNRGLGSINRGSVEFSKDNELYQVNFNNYDGFYYSVVNITGGRLNRFPFVTGTGEFDGTVSIFGVPGNLSAELDLFIPNLVYRGNHYEGSISAELDPQGLSIIDSRFSFENIFLENISGRYDFLDGSLDMFLDLHFDAGDMFITTAVSGMASLPAVNGYRQLIDFEGLFEQARVDIQLSDVAFDEVIVSESLNFVMEIAKQQIFLRGGEEEEIFSLMIDNLNREFSLSLYEGLPLQLKAEGFWEGEGRFTFHAEDMVFDLTFLNALQVPRLEFISGVAKGYLIVTGSIQDPDFYGELNIDEAVLSLGFIPTPLRAHNVALTLHGKEMNFSQFNIIVDRVPVKTKLDFYIEKWIPQYFDMQFSIPRNQPIPSAFTFRGAQVAYDGMIPGILLLKLTM